METTGLQTRSGSPRRLFAAAKLSPRLSSPRPVLRSHLVDRMRAATGAALVLVHGPAGFGKTTAMLQYYAQSKDRGIAAGWLTLDRADNDLVRFLSYLAAAIREIDPGCPAVPGGAAAPRGGGDDGVLELVEHLASIEGRFILFLDDFEHVDSPILTGLVRQIIEHLPAGGQLVIGSRTVPDLGLGRLRAHGRLVEVEAAQLRFSTAETASFLRHQRGLALRDEDIRRLQQRTEGWPAALWLVSLALRDRPDPQAFVETFDGSNAAIADYLVDDVLAGQDARVRDFLLRTSVLSELSAALCDYLLERSDSRDMLERIERAHLFLVAQDGERHWYRYHPLFSGFLREQLRQREPHAMALLHSRASQWWLDAGKPTRAIEHALHGGDAERLQALLCAHAGGLLWQGRARTLVRWYLALPPAMDLRASPALRLTFAWALTLTHRYDQSLRLLDAFEAHQPDRTQADAASVETRVQRAVILAMTDRVRESSALWRACAPALSSAPPFVYAMLCASGGYCLVAESRFEQARGLLEAARRRVLEIGDSFIAPMTLCLEGAIDFAQGRLRNATASFRAALGGAGPVLFPPVAANTVAAAFLAEALYEADQLEEAERLLTSYLPLLRETVAPDQLVTSFVVLARIAAAQGRADDAAEALTEMEIVGHRKGLPRMVASARLERARMALFGGHLRAAQSQFASADEDRIWRPFDGLVTHANDTEAPFIAELRLRLHTGRADSAIAPLRRALKHAEAQQRHRRALKLSILLAQAQCMAGDKLAGLRRLREALQFAAPEGFVRSFVDEGPELLRCVAEVHDASAAADFSLGAFAQRLLAAVGARPDAAQVQPAARADAAGPLSERELQVLRLLAEGHRNRAIAERLFVSETTVKTHLRSINVKLGTQSRTHATAVARQMGLVA